MRSTSLILATGLAQFVNAFPKLHGHQHGTGGSYGTGGIAKPTGGYSYPLNATTVTSYSTLTYTVPASTITVTYTAPCSSAGQDAGSAPGSGAGAQPEYGSGPTTTSSAVIAAVTQPSPTISAAGYEAAGSGSSSGSTDSSSSDVADTSDCTDEGSESTTSSAGSLATGNEDNSSDCTDEAPAATTTSAGSLPTGVMPSYSNSAAPYMNSTSTQLNSTTSDQSTAVASSATTQASSASIASPDTSAGSGTEGYSYDKVPAGITLHKNGQDVGFLKKTTGAPTLQAVQPTEEVPADAAVYTVQGTTMNMTDFGAWHNKIIHGNLAGSKKWLKVAPGTYEFSRGSGVTEAWDSNISFGFSPGGFTLDLRGCTFVQTRVGSDPTYSDQMFYINQSEDFTILGGTFWSDPGMEMWSQGKVIALEPTPRADDPNYVTATIQVEDGYDYEFWGANAGPRSLRCVDTSNGEHYTRPECNFWYMNDFKLTTNRQATAGFGGRSGMKLGYTLIIQSGPNSLTSVASEFNGNLHIKGMTTNAPFAQYGLQGSGKTTATLEDCLLTNLPAMQGYAPRVNGPTLSWGNLASAIFNAGGDPDINFINSYWQYTGQPNDLISMAHYDMPST